MHSSEEGAGSHAYTLDGACELARVWAGPSRRALLLSGSHANGSAVWVTVGGRSVTLSDLDLYAVLPSQVEARAAEARRRADLPGLGRRLLDLGLAAPLEVAFFTAQDLERLPARPATIELVRCGQAIDGDATVLERVPRWRPADVPLEEVLLLLENRAFELLLAWSGLAAAGELARLQSRHAVLKTVLDLATALALQAGELPDRAGERVTWAERRSDPAAARVLENAPELPRLWREGLAWREGRGSALGPAEGRSEWHRVAGAWVATWWELTARIPGAGDTDPYRRALAAARRARWRRRLRQALEFSTRSGAGPAWTSRLARWPAGTPQHRLNAAAAIVLLSAVHGGDAASPALGPSAVANLTALGFHDACADWESAVRALARAWDTWILDGQRTEGRP